MDHVFVNFFFQFHFARVKYCWNFHFKATINGEWGSWGEWSSCSGKCGSRGMMKRQRLCNNPEPYNGGSNCMGPDYEASICETDPCENSKGILDHA